MGFIELITLVLHWTISIALTDGLSVSTAPLNLVRNIFLGILRNITSIFLITLLFIPNGNCSVRDSF